MNPIKTKQSNFIYLGPDAEIADLPCRIEGNNTFSVWKLTDIERKVIAEGGNIHLGIYGARPNPPVSIGVVSKEGPFAQVPCPCAVCGCEADHPSHAAGESNHAFKVSSEQKVSV